MIEFKFGRRAGIEQAGRILTARHMLAADEPLEMLPEHCQNSGRESAETLSPTPAPSGQKKPVKSR